MYDPQSKAWHQAQAQFWRDEVVRRVARVAEAREELAAARKAVREHCAAARKAVRP
jgi:hypothetical protein